MMTVNRVMLLGNVGADVRLGTTGTGQIVANFSLATQKNFYQKDGSKTLRVEWHRVVAWGKLADIAKLHVTRGCQVFVEGELTTREWSAKDGTPRRTTDVVATTIVVTAAKAKVAPDEERGRRAVEAHERDDQFASMPF